MHRFSLHAIGWLLILAGFAGHSEQIFSADKGQVQQAIAKGAAHIKSTLDKRTGGHKTLAYITLLKAGEPHESPLMAAGVKHVLGKIKDGAYKTPPEHLYEAGVDIMFLADLDAVKYKPEIQIITDYILPLQNERGYWTYDPPNQNPVDVNGDVSITHYACLGLWAAVRAGVKIDPQVWSRVLSWQASCNNPDGGYTYWPGSNYGVANGASSMNMTVNSVGTMYIAMLNLDPKRRPKLEKGGKEEKSGTADAPKKKDAGALEAVNLDTQEAEEAKALAAATGRIPDAALASAKTAFRWVSTRFDSINRESPGKAYYYYSLERMGALVNVTKIADRDWFNECADALISAQNADGSWSMTGQPWGVENDTCFCVLFLTRSTGKILKRTNLEPPVGGGLLSGGRGLPDDLKELDANGNVKKKKEKSSLDDLLASLQDPDKVDLEETQTELVEQIQLGDKLSLIGKKDTLLKLAQHRSADVRRTAIWAIGRTGDLSLARFAVLGLDDPDSGVMIESHLALCWTARKPKAFSLPEDPLDGLAADAGPDEKSAAIDSWRRQALRLWGEWYLRHRPYAERGDEFETNLRNRLLELK